MAETKYSDEYIKQICEQKNLLFLDIKTMLSGKKYRRMVSFICQKHADKGEQIRPSDKILRSNKPCQYCNHSKLKETFEEEMGIINPNIEILPEYVNTEELVKCKCKIDGYE